MMVPGRYVACGTLMSDEWQELTFHYPCSIVGITAYLKKNRSIFLKVCGLQTTVKNQIMACRKLELLCSYVSESTVTPSPRYDWGMEGIELHCSNASKIKTRKATKLHEDTSKVRKENLDHNRIMKWFIPGNLCWKGENGCYEKLGNSNYKNLHVWNAKNAWCCKYHSHTEKIYSIWAMFHVSSITSCQQHHIMPRDIITLLK